LDLNAKGTSIWFYSKSEF
jgi:hypothetical protein